MRNENRLITDLDAAPLCGTTAHMLRLARARGWIWDGVPGPPFLKFGRAVRYRLADIQAWIDAHEPVRSNAEHHAAKMQEQKNGKI
jgi:hypothetical protein